MTGYDPSTVQCFVAFSSTSIRNLFLDLDHYGGNDPNGMFSLFCKPVARELAHKLAVIFRHLVKGSSFPACWRLAAVVPVPKLSLSSEVGDYGRMTITPLPSKVFEKILARKLSHF